MRIRRKKMIARALTALIIAAVITGAAVVVSAQAETTALQGSTWEKRHEATNTERTGLFKRGGHWYYGHKTSSALYKVGDLTRDSFRIIGGRYYYFKHDGRMLTHSTHYMTVKKGHGGKCYVTQVYWPGTGKKQRFNVGLRRGQYKKDGKWITETGMPYDLYGQIDMQP